MSIKLRKTSQAHLKYRSVCIVEEIIMYVGYVLSLFFRCNKHREQSEAYLGEQSTRRGSSRKSSIEWAGVSRTT